MGLLELVLLRSQVQVQLELGRLEVWSKHLKLLRPLWLSRLAPWLFLLKLPLLRQIFLPLTVEQLSLSLTFHNLPQLLLSLWLGLLNLLLLWPMENKTLLLVLLLTALLLTALLLKLLLRSLCLLHRILHLILAI